MRDILDAIIRKIVFSTLVTLGFFVPLVHADDPSPGCVAPGTWQFLANQAAPRAMADSEVMQRAAKQRIVMLGEDHDNPEHHRWQLYTIVALHALQPHMALGFEAFPRRVQPVLDRWVAGELSEAEFLKAVDWNTIWTYDAALYMPMFHYARQQHIPLIALNIERSLVSKTGEAGWENVPVAEREGLSDPAAPSPDYLDMLKSVFSQHGHAGHGKKEDAAMDEQVFRRFVQGQQVWDRAMAEALVAASKRDNIKLVVGVMGAGHLFHGYGVPHQIKSQGVDELMSLLPWDGAIDCEELTQHVADAVFGLRKVEGVDARRKPKLGVYLERTKDGVKVSKLSPKSVAVDAGIKAGDFVLQVAGRPVSEVSDVVTMVQDTAPGLWMPIQIRRGNKTLEILAKFPLKTPESKD